ncbi:hypothetical protein L1987_45588 [Smallanthus sonchifolius]|uniref:Uncharacterized protein n=1 Tax=Smallanthus sonchifolius TaxID=185202 RepID=A0ACB9FXG9_9ASTR|nr:hypothetical protein L1987_45588 [Smallanthus sonchifolius]
MYTIFIRNSYDPKKLDLVELHGMLKTYDLEMSQDSKLLNNVKKGVGVSTQGAAFFTPSVLNNYYTVTFPTDGTSTSSNTQSSSEQPRNKAFMANGPEFFDFIIATETPSAATEPSKEEADEKRKGKMPVTEEEAEKLVVLSLSMFPPILTA